MRFLSLLAGIIFLSLPVKATHLYGGEISFRCLGGGQFEFSLTLFHECGPMMSPTELLGGPQGPISLFWISTERLTPPCHDVSISTGCDTANPGLGRTLYQGVTTLSGVPPVQGWKFSWTSCCRPTINLRNTNDASFFFQTVMYPDPINSCSSSAQWGEVQPALDTGVYKLKNYAVQPLAGDSLFYKMVTPMAQSNTAITFTSGYSATAPFPDQSEDPGNGPVIIDPASGTITTAIRNAMSHPRLFVYGVEVECWRGGHMISTTARDFSVALGPELFGSNDYPPFANIDTALWNFKPIPGKPIIDGTGTYHIKVEPGDTLMFEASAQDFDYNILSSGALIPQNIIFSATGFALDTVLNNFKSRPVITPKAPQSGFSQALNNNVIFLWAIDSEHVARPYTSYWFQFNFRDDACPLGLNSTLNMEIAVMSKTNQIRLNEEENLGFDIYPNPAEKFIQLKGVEQRISYRIFDLAGRLILEDKLDRDQSIDISHFNPGIYLIDAGGIVRKFYVE